MAPRAYWKGYLKLSLVSCPIALYPASSTSEKVSFHRINRQTGNRLKQLLVDSESEEPVNKEDIARSGRKMELRVGERAGPTSSTVHFGRRRASDIAGH